MNAASVVVLVALLALAILAAWRTFKKGMPCECGGNRKACSCCSACHGKRSESGES